MWSVLRWVSLTERNGFEKVPVIPLALRVGGGHCEVFSDSIIPKIPAPSETCETDSECARSPKAYRGTSEGRARLAECVESEGTGVEGRVSTGHGGGYWKHPAQGFSG